MKHTVLVQLEADFLDRTALLKPLLEFSFGGGWVKIADINGGLEAKETESFLEQLLAFLDQFVVFRTVGFVIWGRGRAGHLY